jgi:hypothetical protein
MINRLTVRRIAMSAPIILLTLASLAHQGVGQSAPSSYPDQPQCVVKSVQEISTPLLGFFESPSFNSWVATQYDANGVDQVYIAKSNTLPTLNSEFTCITCTFKIGAPKVGLNKFMTTWHPSGKWLSIGVEEPNYSWSWLPQSMKRGFLQSGVWMNLWITTPAGDKWYQMTNFGSGTPGSGCTGVAFSPDGVESVAAVLIGNADATDAFGIWKLYGADFSVNSNGVPSLTNIQDITPAGAKWIEPGNFSPDGQHMLLSSDIGLTDAEGQDQWVLDINTGKLQNLTNSPNVWDEHGFYSPSGKKISFMSSYPYRSDPTSFKTYTLETEFMLMDADGGHLQQLTHFNVPGYPESQPNRTVAAIAWFITSSQLYAIVMGPEFISSSWIITFAGACGA